MLALGVGLSGVNAWADFTPEAFYVDYAFNVPTDILTSHRRAIVHPEAQVDLAAAANAGTIVFAYISVGELGANAPHRAEALSLGLPLRGKNTIWNSDLLDLTSGAWAEFFVETIARAAVQKGFTGFFLDTLDSIEIEATAAQVEVQRAGLVALINRLHSTFPSLPIVVNRGFSTLPQLAGVAQGLLVESVYAAYDFETKVYRPTTADTTAQLVTIMQNAVAAGFEVFVLDYADPTNPADALLTANRILQAGYHTFVSTPDLTGVALGPWVPVAPMITSQPLGLTLREGQDWELRVTNLGTPRAKLRVVSGWFCGAERGGKSINSGECRGHRCGGIPGGNIKSVWNREFDVCAGGHQCLGPSRKIDEPLGGSLGDGWRCAADTRGRECGIRGRARASRGADLGGLSSGRFFARSKFGRGAGGAASNHQCQLARWRWGRGSSVGSRAGRGVSVA